jgi:dTDP-4-amino-4,6-dideoxygalactose transaminase
MAMEIGPEDEVITTPYTFFSTAGSVIRLGAGILFADIDSKTYNIDPEEVRKIVETRAEFDGQTLRNRRTGRRIRALLPVHLFGQSCDMAPLLELAQKFGIRVVEDAAQAIGAEYQGARVGGLGNLGIFSFFPSKNLGGLGDGGMVTTVDEKLADRIRSLRVHGAHDRYFHDVVGVNSRLDAIQAASLLVKMKYLDEWTEARGRNAARYVELLGEHGLLDGDRVIPPARSPFATRHVFNQFVIRIPGGNRDGLRAHLRDRGIASEIYYPLSLHQQKCFADLGYRDGDFPRSERAARETLALPVYPELTAEQQATVVKAIGEYLPA